MTRDVGTRTAQPGRLFDPGVADGALTNNQQRVLQAAQDHTAHGGITATQAGAVLHGRRGTHPEDRPCLWCKSEGRQVLEALKARGLVRRRRTGVYQPVRRVDVSVNPLDEIGF